MTFDGLCVIVLCLIGRGSFEESMFFLCFGVLSILDERCFRIIILCIIFIFYFCSTFGFSGFHLFYLWLRCSYLFKEVGQAIRILVKNKLNGKRQIFSMFITVVSFLKLT